MSIEVMRYVWNHSTAKGNARLMLLAIADIANDTGDAYPGVDRLAEKCNMSRRTAQECIQDLERTKELYVYENVGTRTKSGWTNLYRVHLEGVVQPPVRTPSGSLAVARAVSEKKSRSFPKDVQTVAPLKDVQPAAPHDVQTVAPESSVYSPENPSVNKSSIETTIKAWLDGQTTKPVVNQYANKGVRANAKAIADAGFTAEQITAYVKELAAQPYWSGKLVTIGYVANNIAAHYAAKKPVPVNPAHVPFDPAEVVPDAIPMPPEAQAALQALVKTAHVNDEVIYAKLPKSA